MSSFHGTLVFWNYGWRRWDYLLDVEARPNVDEHAVGVGELALDVERVGEGDEDGFLLCGFGRGGLAMAGGDRQNIGARTIQRGPPQLDDAQALLELGLGGGELGVRRREVLDLGVELLLDGAQLLGAEGAEVDCGWGVMSCQ